jgi:carbamoyltransferase
MKILGINAFHPDSSACIVVDGKVVSAIEEERLVRLKHWAGFPNNAIKACLDSAEIGFGDIDKIAINRDKGAHKKEKVLFTIKNRPKLSNLIERINNRKKVDNISMLLSELFNTDEKDILEKIIPVEHHQAHLASTFFTSPFPNSVICSIDGFGDFLSTMWGFGKGNDISLMSYRRHGKNVSPISRQSIWKMLIWRLNFIYRVSQRIVKVLLKKNITG